jgi:ABC-type branched-subunit amino acid transport system ATPase component
MPLLEVHGLTVRFGGLVAVNEVAFEAHEREILGLIGPNGAGKTTCFNLISGFLAPDSGEVRFDGDRITKLAPNILARRGLVRTFQKQSLFPRLTVVDNVVCGEQAVRRARVWPAVLRAPGERRTLTAMRTRAMEILEFLDMTALHDSRAGDLAYGDQRKLAIGIALAARPKLLMLDEPAAGINPRESEQLRELIGRVRGTGVTVVLVEHDMNLVMNVCDRLVVLDSGRKIAEGKPDDIRADPEVIRVYLGERRDRRRQRRHA